MSILWWVEFAPAIVVFVTSVLLTPKRYHERPGWFSALDFVEMTLMWAVFACLWWLWLALLLFDFFVPRVLYRVLGGK